jgi:hypothetical protein
MIRIYADFNAMDEDRSVRLNTVGSLRDIERYQGSLEAGRKVTLYCEDFEVPGKLVFDGIWHGVPDWSSIKYYDEAQGPGE